MLQSDRRDLSIKYTSTSEYAFVLELNIHRALFIEFRVVLRGDIQA